MTNSLNRETRKALVKLAESNTSEYGKAARIILSYKSGQNLEEIARVVHTSVEEVEQWCQSFDAEGMAIFTDTTTDSGQELPSLEQTKAEAVEEPETDFDQAEEAGDDDDEEEEDGYTPDPVTRPPHKLSRHRPSRRSLSHFQKSHQNQMHDEQRQSHPTSLRSSEAISIDDAVSEGLEDLMDEVDEEPFEDKTPGRKVVFNGDFEEELPQEDRQAVPSVSRRAEPVSTELTSAHPPTDVPISVSALADAFGVNMAHARHVSNECREFFDATSNIHRLRPHYRDLLHAAALLHNVGYRLDKDNFHTIGRDLILSYKLKDISDDERQIIAVMTALQQGTPRPLQEPAFVALPDKLKSDAEALSAILRIGVALDYSRTQSSTITDVYNAPGELTLVIGGREAPVDIARAQQKADLWNRLFSASELRFVTADETHYIKAISDTPSLSVELNPASSSVEVSNTLRQHYVARLNYLVNRLQEGDTALLLPLWREFQRLIGIFRWFIPGVYPENVAREDTEWLTRIFYSALHYATLADRSIGILEETDPEQDDPQAIQSLQIVCTDYQQLADRAAGFLMETLQSERYQLWLHAVQERIEVEEDPDVFVSRLAEHIWSYLGEIRQTTDRIKRAGWNANLEQLLTLRTMQSLTLSTRRLHDSLVYTTSLLGTEVEQVLEFLSPLLDYLHAWQRAEQVTQRINTDLQKVQQDTEETEEISPSTLALQALAFIMRERADNMRWNLPDMWQPMETTSFRRALALAIARP